LIGKTSNSFSPIAYNIIFLLSAAVSSSYSSSSSSSGIQNSKLKYSYPFLPSAISCAVGFVLYIIKITPDFSSCLIFLIYLTAVKG